MAICGLARAIDKDIDRCYEAVKYAPLHRIHTFLATSDIHLKYKLKISRQECIEQAVKAVRFAKERVHDVEFSAEDAGRSDPAFMAEVFEAVIEAGATTINIPDTVGFVTPQEYGAMIDYLITHTPNSNQAIFSTHCHNDLGLAVANSLAGIQSGARQVEVTINGIGERAGNSSLEEVVMALVTRPTLFPVTTTVDTTQITRTSKLVSSATGIIVQPNKAIVGANAFAHEAGIHQDGMLKHAATYEIMAPEMVGVTTNLVMGKHSGKHAFTKQLERLGYGGLEPDVVQKAFKRFKKLADKKKHLTDQDLEAIITDETIQTEELWKVNSVVVVSGDHVLPTATISLTSPEGVVVEDAALGTGPIGAVYKAIARITGVDVRLTDFHIQSVSEGREALGRVNVRIAPGQLQDDQDALHVGEDVPTYGGTATNIDILVASSRAFVTAINQMLSIQKMGQSKESDVVERPGHNFVASEQQVGN